MRKSKFETFFLKLEFLKKMLMDPNNYVNMIIIFCSIAVIFILLSLCFFYRGLICSLCCRERVGIVAPELHV